MDGVWQWVLAAAAAFLVGVSKTGIAGLGILSVVIFASVLPARASVGVALLVLLSADVVAVAAYRRTASWAHLARLFPWAAGGVVIGALLMRRIDDETARRVIGAIVVALVAFQALRRARGAAAAGSEAAGGPRWATVIPTGIGAGITTMLANAAGPIMVIYLLAMRLPKMLFMGTAAWFFLVLNAFKVPFSCALGLINARSLPLSAALAPFAVAGALTGRKLIGRINQRQFETLVIVLTAAAGLRLLLT